MEILIKLDQTELLIQESTHCRLVIQNTGATVIEVPNPELHHEWPIFRVVGSMADKVNDFKPARMWKKTGFVPIATDPSLGITQKLAPGDTLTFEFSLLDRLELPETGKYEITAVIDWKGKIFTSPPLYVTILQAIPVFSDYVYAHSGVSPLLYSAWIHKGQDNGLVLFRGLDLLDKFRQTLSFRITEALVNVQPVVSITPNGLPWPDHWVAWIDNKQLVVAFVTRESVVPPLRKISIELSNPLLIRPILMDPSTRSGHVLLWSDLMDGGVIYSLLIGDSITQEFKVPMDITRPSWTRLFCYSNGLRRLLLLSEQDNHVILYLIEWPQGGVLQNPVEAGRWPGEFIAAGAIMDEEDNIHGATMRWDGSQDVVNPILKLSKWSIGANGELKTTGDDIINLPASARLKDAVLRVNEAAEPYSLLHCEIGQWIYWMYILPGDSPQPLPQEAAQLVGSPDFAFLDGLNPILLYYHSEMGLQHVPIGFELENGPEA